MKFLQATDSCYPNNALVTLECYLFKRAMLIFI